ncbi:DNA helicase [Fusarium longipes]|uniref:DNA helicase n=1 Tax=Fusarium longipes TaxID=694270 RepID=A0A395SLL2_9HYPO|nr:DNA helicase [Fusarium longipes]
MAKTEAEPRGKAKAEPKTASVDGRRDCRLMSHPETLDRLSGHLIAEHEIVLLVRRPFPDERRNVKKRGDDYSVKTYSNRSTADSAYKQSEGH